MIVLAEWDWVAAGAHAANTIANRAINTILLDANLDISSSLNFRTYKWCFIYWFACTRFLLGRSPPFTMIKPLCILLLQLHVEEDDELYE